MYVRIYHRLPARLRHLAQLGLAHRPLGNSPDTRHSRLPGNSPITHPSLPLRALPPSPAICLLTWTLSMLSHGPPLMWVENNEENYIKQLIESLRSVGGGGGDDSVKQPKEDAWGKKKCRIKQKNNQKTKHHCTASRNWMKRLKTILSLEVM